jgi:hypothetical protein
MNDTNRRGLIFLALLLGVLSACSQMGGAQRRADDARIDALISQVRMGESRKEVETTLGHPYSVQTEGHDTVLTYVAGSQNDSGDEQRASANMQAFSSVLGALGSFGGNKLGEASSIGSQVVGAGSELSSAGGSANANSEETRVEVRLRGNKVVSVDRFNSGRVGIGAEN